MTRPRYNLAIVCLLLVLTIPSALSAQPLHVPLPTPELDKSFSEFNHHLTGYFLLAIGLSAFLGNALPRMAFIRKIWPFFFVLPGLYLALMSDPDVWPMGQQNWLQAFQSNPEAAQHKTYAALLLAIGILEFQRSRGKLGRFLATWSFPLLALFGAVLLFFHEHAGAAGEMAHSMPGMDHETHMMMTESMLRVKQEHLWFSIVGFGVILFKFLTDGGYWKKSFVPFLWPACISLLGVLLILYSE